MPRALAKVSTMLPAPLPSNPRFSADDTMDWASKLEKPMRNSTDLSMEGEVWVYAKS